MKNFLWLTLLLLSCFHIYKLPEQVPTFEELGINASEFNSIEKIIIYAETNIETIITDCHIMPWNVMRCKQTDVLGKCAMVAWMCEQAELVESAWIISAGSRYSLRNWYVADELGNPLYNYDPTYVNVYQQRTLNSVLYDFSQNRCGL